LISREDVSWGFVQARGLKIHYGELGTGSPLICLHGTGPGSDAWSNFRHNVEALSEQHRVLLIDLPRFGKSEMVAVDEPRLDFLSSVVAGLMGELGIDSADFVGNSMGAQAAMKLAIDSPELVKRLVLVAPAVVGYSVFSPMPTESVGQIAAYYKGDGPSRTKMGRLMRGLAYDPRFVTEEMIDERYEASVRPEVLTVNAGTHWARQSLGDDIELCGAPTLLVWGQDDRATAIDHALLLLRRMPDARLHVFGRCGHWAQSEHAAEFNRLTLDFLAS